ncbi:hypothetical protein PWT90_03677 [Aphanocladium album]|nr:hypothetical protein PWT90_03677 [Aphanocladium album]
MRSSVLIDAVGPYDQDFWNVQVVNAAQTYAVVWHAGLALTEMYRSKKYEEIGHSARSSSQLRALQHYGYAVKSILNVVNQTAIGRDDKNAVLLGSLMLIGFACLNDDDDTKMTHMRSAFQIFSKWRIWDHSLTSSSQNSVISDSSLMRQFQRFEAQASTYLLEGVSWTTVPRITQGSEPLISTTAAFTEFLDLSVPFLQGIEQAAAAARVNGPVPEMVHYTRRLFRSWKLRFMAFLQARCHTQVDEECILTMRIWSIAMEIRLFLERTSGPEAELAYDTWEALFETQTDLAEQLYALVAKKVEERQPMLRLQPFSLTSSICDGLAVAVRCRKGSVRRRIATILRQWPYRDGISNPPMTAALLEAWIRVEEEGFLLHGSTSSKNCRCIPGQYICAFHRCSMHTGGYDGVLRRGTLRMFMWADSPAPPHLVEREVELVW